MKNSNKTRQDSLISQGKRETPPLINRRKILYNYNTQIFHY